VSEGEGDLQQKPVKGGGEGDLQQKPVKGGGEGGERWGSAGRQAGSRYTREQLALRLAADCSALFSSDSIE
jgi:hypothetical protein